MGLRSRGDYQPDIPRETENDADCTPLHLQRRIWPFSDIGSARYSWAGAETAIAAAIAAFFGCSRTKELFDCIEVFHHQRRRESASGSVEPEAFEQRMAQAA